MATPLLIASIIAASSPATAAPDTHRAEARDILREMVAAPTVAGRTAVPALIDTMTRRLAEGGVPHSAIAILPHKETAAMIVRVAGRDATLKPILISAHLDVVDASAADWGTDPFTLVEKDGVFYGRGVYDNKAGAAAMMSAILRLTRDQTPLRRTVVFAFVGDEETAMETSRLIADHPWVRGAELAINTDAGFGLFSANRKHSIYFVQGAEKVYATFQLTARNPGGHSSRPRLDNAIFDIAGVIERLRSFRSPIVSNDLSRAYLASVATLTQPPLRDTLKRFSDHPEEGADAETLFANPDYVGVTRTTCIPTMLKAGHAENALPQSATITVNCRIFPGESVDLIRQRIVTHVADPHIEIRSLYPDVSSPVSDMRPDLAKAIGESIRKHHPGATVAPYLEAGATDGRIYREAGIPTYGTAGHFHPSGSANLHGKDENLPVAAFYETVDHVHDLAISLGRR